MNAYIASFMLLVFNAVGLAIPATEAVAEERIASSARSSQAQANADRTNETLIIGQAEQCSKAKSTGLDHIDQQISSLFSAIAPLPIAGDENRDTAANSAYLLVRSILADKLHVEGRP